MGERALRAVIPRAAAAQRWAQHGLDCAEHCHSAIHTARSSSTSLRSAIDPDGLETQGSPATTEIHKLRPDLVGKPQAASLHSHADLRS